MRVQGRFSRCRSLDQGERIPQPADRMERLLRQTGTRTRARLMERVAQQRTLEQTE